MTIREVLEFAKRIALTVRDGFALAARYLRREGIDWEIARWALLGV
jgi:hypothetical protein